MEETLEKTLELIKRVKEEKDKHSLDLLIEKYYKRVERIVRLRLTSQLKNKLDTLDIVQEVFLKVIQSFDKFNDFEREGAFLHWLSQIVENKIKDYIEHFSAKKRDSRQEILTSSLIELSDTTIEFTFKGEDPSPSSVFEEKENIEKLENAIMQLSEEEREIIIMHDYEGLTFQEIGEILNKSCDAVRMIRSRALVKLAKMLENKI